MSLEGEALFDRLPFTSGLRKSDNPVRELIDLSLGSYMDSLDDYRGFNCWFLEFATGKYLDLHGNMYGVLRRIDESDDDYRNRIILEKSGHYTVDYLLGMFGDNLYADIPDYNPRSLKLTSDNPYWEDGFMLNVSDADKTVIMKKFITEGLNWL